jgi:hypothetical protein
LLGSSHLNVSRRQTSQLKTYGDKTVEKKVQPLTGTFRGTVDLGTYGGHGPKGVGAICDPTAFNRVIEDFVRERDIPILLTLCANIANAR